MVKVCLLKSEYNSCPYKGENQQCNGNVNCGMLSKLEYGEKKRQEYVRKPRWYEKYYS